MEGRTGRFGRGMVEFEEVEEEVVEKMEVKEEKVVEKTGVKEEKVVEQKEVKMRRSKRIHQQCLPPTTCAHNTITFLFRLGQPLAVCFPQA